MTGEQEAYTPTREEVQADYLNMLVQWQDVRSDEALARWNRWLTAELADAERRGAEKALTEAATALVVGGRIGGGALFTRREIASKLRYRAATYRKAE